MKGIVYSSFFVVIIIFVLVFKDWLLVNRKLKKTRIKDIEKLYRVRDMGEAFLNVLSILYFPFVLDAFIVKGTELIVSITGLAMIGVIVIWLNWRIYICKKAIKELEEQNEPQMSSRICPCTVKQ